MRRAAAVALFAVVHGIAACGPSQDERLGRAVAGAAEPAVAAFVTDLEADRLENARARGTAAFQAAVGVDAMRVVTASLRGVLGPLSGRTFTAAEGLPEAPEGELPGAGTLRYAGRYAKGEAELDVKVVRGADGAWRIDGFVARSPALTWTLR